MGLYVNAEGKKDGGIYIMARTVLLVCVGHALCPKIITRRRKIKRTIVGVNFISTKAVLY